MMKENEIVKDKFCWKVYRFFKNMRYNIRILPRKFRNLIYWIPKLWDDADWDDRNYWEIVQYKLQKMSNFYQHGKIAAMESKDWDLTRQQSIDLALQYITDYIEFWDKCEETLPIEVLMKKHKKLHKEYTNLLKKFNKTVEKYGESWHD